MKYGRQLEHESVPEWRLHNLDYNTLKHEIKVHTTRRQSAAAIAIPGHQDTSLRKFEDGLYLELCRQHDRVGLFITSKADEISRRLVHLAGNLRRWVARAPDESTTSVNPVAALKRHRKYARYERELRRCSDDIHALDRFASAQVVAFRKIIKKYRKWTGSTTLGSRFTEVLSDPKSFARRDFSPLQRQHDDIFALLQEATPHISETASSSDEPMSPEDDSTRRSPPRVSFEPLPPSHLDMQTKYWNEYDNGSDAGGPEDDYAIYCDPDEDMSFPGFGYVHAVLALPFEKAKQWFRMRRNPERDPLLSPDSAYHSGYASTTTAHTDSDGEGYASSDDILDGIPHDGYAALYAFPSIADQKVMRYRERALLWGTVGAFFASFVLLGIAGVLITTGRHKLRVEVDAAVTVGVMASLFCACSALGMTLYRRDPLSVSYRLMVWSACIAASILNGMLLVLVVGNTP